MAVPRTAGNEIAGEEDRMLSAKTRKRLKATPPSRQPQPAAPPDAKKDYYGEEYGRHTRNEVEGDPSLKGRAETVKKARRATRPKPSA